jgi:hypothetical protein
MYNVIILLLIVLILTYFLTENFATVRKSPTQSLKSGSSSKQSLKSDSSSKQQKSAGFICPNSTPALKYGTNSFGCCNPTDKMTDAGKCCDIKKKQINKGLCCTITKPIKCDI